MPPCPEVTIAIPTLLTGDLVSQCLRALDEQIYRSFEVIVINNSHAPFHPPDGLTFPCRALTPGKNIGFGAAVNMAARESAAPLIATLNDDTEPDPQWLGALVQEISRSGDTGMCAARIRLFREDCIDSAGMLICLDGSSKQRGQGQPVKAFDAPADVLMPSGCAALYRRKMLEEVGFFDEEFFLYCEDTDLGLRARWAGWGCRYAPAATVRHRYSSTLGAHSPAKALLVERNRIWVAVKNFPLALLAVSPLIAVARYCWQLAAMARQRGAASAFIRAGNSVRAAVSIPIRAHAETIRAFPRLLRERVAVRRVRRIGSLSFLKLIFRHRITAREIAEL